MPATNKDIRFELLRTAPLDCWIALSEDESAIVATASTFEEVVKNSAAAGVKDPLILKAPKSWLPFSM